jgi:hypothetical protein
MDFGMSGLKTRLDKNISQILMGNHQC